MNHLLKVDDEMVMGTWAELCLIYAANMPLLHERVLACQQAGQFCCDDDDPHNPEKIMYAIDALPKVVVVKPGPQPLKTPLDLPCQPGSEDNLSGSLDIGSKH